MNHDRILVVDDEEHIRKLCSEILQRKKFNVTTFSTANAALDAARNNTYDLLLTDISMPGMDGLELLRQIKDLHRDITAVVMTGYGTVNNVVQSLHLGAHGFLIKPFSQRDLVQSVEEALERNQLIRENTRLKLLVPLFELGKTFLSELHLEALLDKVTEVSIKETRSDSASVVLLKESGDPIPKSFRGSKSVLGDDAYRSMMENCGAWIVQHKKPLLLDEDHPAGPIRGFGTIPILDAAIVMMPLISKDKVVGILNLCKKKRGKRSFAQSELDLISVLCGQAAIAIENAKLFEEVETKNKDLENFYFESVKALAQAIEAKDSVTGSHGDRLESYALAIADRFGLTDKEKISLRYAAALHDIGKIGVSELVLKKRSKLTSEEYDEMKTHPERGGKILREVKFLDPVIPIIHYHHEQFDGRGYPEGLSGESIPIGSRIVAVLDAFDAMTSDRPYRKGLPMDTAVKELMRYSGSQFDPKVVNAFIDVLGQSPNPS
jgi:response regulator RpfG family c-di-GMP phosphodiesterase